MKGKVLVDFYNLELHPPLMGEELIKVMEEKVLKEVPLSGFLPEIKEPWKNYAKEELNPLTEEAKLDLKRHFLATMVGRLSFCYPNRDKWKDVEKFVNTHAPFVIQPLTAEREKEIQSYSSQLNITTSVEDSIGEILKSYPNEEILSDVLTTMEGFEAMFRISWFYSSGFTDFVARYLIIKVLIDSYLQHSAIPEEELKLVKSELDIYMEIYSHVDLAKSVLGKASKMFSNLMNNITSKRYLERMCKFDIFPLWELFYIIYDEVISVLEGKIQIQRCDAYPTPRIKDGCKKLVLLSSNKRGRKPLFCSDKCRRRIHKHEKTHHEDKIKRMRGEW